MDTKYKTIFAGQFRAIEPSEETRNEVKASLTELRQLLPTHINPEEEPALLFVAGNLAVAGYINLNDDGLDIETALKVYKKFEKQQINLEHDRKSVVGYIVHAGLSELGTDRVITEEEARSSGKPFNIAIVFALWRVVNRELCAYIEQISNPSHPEFNALSLSFEMGFEGYRVVGLPKGNPEISAAQLVVKPDDKEYEKVSAALRANGGSGISPDDNNLRLFRIIDEDVIPLGGGVVTVPAAAVQGLVAIKSQVAVNEEDMPEEDEDEEESEKPESQEENNHDEDNHEKEHTEEDEEDDDDDAESESKRQLAAALQQTKDVVAAFLEHVDKKSVKHEKIRVSPITLTNLSNMNKDIQALKERLTKVANVEELKEVVASASPIIDAIVAESERQENARKEAETQAARIEETKQQALAAADELRKELEAVRAELGAIKQAQAAAAAEQAFNERMSTIDATFELNDEERGFIVAEVRDLDNEAFAKWMEKSKKLMKEKMKDEKKKHAEEAKASVDALLSKLTEKGVKAKLTDAGIEIEEVIASAVKTEVSTPVHNLVQPDNNDLKALAAKALPGMIFPSNK